MDQLTVTFTKGSDDNWSIAVAEPAREHREDKYKLVPDMEGMYRAVALRNIFDSNGHLVIDKGTRSGLLWGSGALSQYGICWVGEDAKVVNGGRVSRDARVYGSAVVDNAEVTDNATVMDRAHIGSGATIGGRATVASDAKVSGNANVGHDSFVGDQATIDGPVTLRAATRIGDDVHIDTRQHIVVHGGLFNRDMKIAGAHDFLQLHTYWGPLVVAKTAAGAWLGTVGCQSFETLQELRDLADDEGGDFEANMLPGWFAMMEAAFAAWGLSKETIENTTMPAWVSEE